MDTQIDPVNRLPYTMVGNYKLYIDNKGGTHLNPNDAVLENQRTEHTDSHGMAGGCPQDIYRYPIQVDPNNYG